MASINRRTIRWTTQHDEPRTSQKYEAVYRDRAGKRHRRLFDLKRDAQRWLDEQTTGIVTGQWADPQAGKETVRSYGERWRSRQVIATGTASAYATVLLNHVYPVVGSMRMDAIRRADIQTLVKAWESSSAASTVEVRYTILAIMMRAAVKDRVIPASPCLDIKLPRIEPRSALVPITTETVLALRQAMPPRYRAFVTLGAGTGMRRGELLGLTLDRVAFEFATIRVDRQLSRASRSDAVMFGPPKTDSSTRTIPVAPVVLHTIREHVAEFVQAHRNQDGQRECGHTQPVQHQAPFAAVAIICCAWARAHDSAASTSSTVLGSAKSPAAASTLSRVSTMPRKGSRPDTNAATHSSLAAL